MRTSPQRRRYSNERKASTSSQQIQNPHSRTRTRGGYNNNTSSLLTMEDDEVGVPYNNMMVMTPFEVDGGAAQQQFSLSNSTTNSRNKSQQVLLVDSIVHAAQVCNSLAAQYCGLCTVYMDQQVQYELFTTTTSNAAAVLKYGMEDEYDDEYYNEDHRHSSPQAMAAHAARMLLFDEESVVESVSSRS